MALHNSLEGAGSVTWWGFSPALDLLVPPGNISIGGSIREITEDKALSQTINILLVGSGDSRHVLKTVAGLRQSSHSKTQLHVYIIENNLELIGRHLLFLTLAFEPPERMGLQEKAETFLELFGNSLIRSPTANYLQEVSHWLIQFVTESDLQEGRLPSVDLSALRFKERDQLEGIFKFWCHPDPRSFQIHRMWDVRLRQYLDSRYDFRQGAFDWDLTMKLHQRGAQMVSKAEYMRWRETGVAFELREGLYDTANRSLASGLLLKRNGERVPVRGYWGDIVSSPYISFGIETDNENLKQTANGLPTKTAQDVSLYNLQTILKDLVPKKEAEESEPSVSGEEATQRDGGGSAASLDSKNHSSSLQSQFSIHFLPLNCLDKLAEKNCYNQLFNIMYFSCSMIHQLKPALRRTAAPGASLIVEMARYILDVHKDQAAGLLPRVNELAKEAGFTPTVNNETIACFELREP
ncbi:DAAF3 factor, partial [Polypterus senegalus]|nr:dynein assembly factor 3, axonemal-like [Polypterus senegalus]MBN3294742.1 DAAF3 factor [Polypterus senegalus]